MRAASVGGDHAPKARQLLGGPRDLLVPSANGNPLSASTIRQRVLAKTTVEANELPRQRRVARDRRMHSAHAAADPNQPAARRRPRPCVRAAAGRPHRPDLTLRIYQQLLKRKRREEFRERVNDLLGPSPAALSRRPEPDAKKRRAQFRAQVAAGGVLSGCE